MNSVDKQYLNIARDILNDGIDTDDRTGVGTLSLIGKQMRFNVSEHFPLLLTKNINLRSIIHELLWFLRGDTNNFYLKSRGVNIWNAWADDEGNLGPIYSAMWRRWPVQSPFAELVDVRTGPAPGPVELPIASRPEHIDSEYAGDLERFQENYGDPYEIIKELGTLGGRNTIYLVRFVNTGNYAEVTRPNIRNNIHVKDTHVPSVADVACIGNPKRPFNEQAYSLWRNMVVRCHQATHPSYKYYGLEGTYVSPRWLCFENFLEDISCIPFYEEWCQTPHLYSLDKDYFGSNCYDISTTIFLPRSYNIGLNRDGVPVEVEDTSGNKYLFETITDFTRFLGVNVETYRNFRNGIYESRKFDGYKIEHYSPPEGKLVRRRLFSDQISDLIKGLRERPNSRRHIVSGWNPEVLSNETIQPNLNPAQGLQALPPCHVMFQFYAKPIPGGDRYRLSCQLFQRSADFCLGVPYNIASYSLLLMMVAQVVNMEVGEFIWTGGDVHIYKNQIEGIVEQLGRNAECGEDKPQVVINRNRKELNEFIIDDFELVNYEPLPAIKFPQAAV